MQVKSKIEAIIRNLKMTFGKKGGSEGPAQKRFKHRRLT
jgi:hypothetical protein